jgi:hypothetical protein
MLRIVLGIHALVTLAAGVVLVAAPGAIPSAVGIRIEPGVYLLCYLLAGMEVGFAVLSWGARSITDQRALRLIIVSFIVMHGVTGLLEVYAFAAGVSAAIWSNIAVRVVALAVFAYFGFRRSEASAARPGRR